jgi:hypothetical protein
MNDNYDSPFHRATESPLDRQIQEVKKRFCEFLKYLLSNIKDIEIVEMSHPMMSCYITVVLKFNIYQIRIHYDMDKRQFEEPQFSIGGHLHMRDGFIFEKEEIGLKLITIFAKFYEVSQLNGMGTKYGGCWYCYTEKVITEVRPNVMCELGNCENILKENQEYKNLESTNKLARKEYERLKEKYRKNIISKKEETERQVIRDAEYKKKLVEIRGAQIVSKDK